MSGNTEARVIMSGDALNRARGLYLKLMEKCLINTIYEDGSIYLGNASPFNPGLRAHGEDWPAVAHSMIGAERMFHLRCMCEYVINHGVPGDFIETGVWRGGASIMMRAVLETYEVTDRTVWVADSFAGLPAPNPAQYPADAEANFHEFSELAVSLEEVQANFAKYGLLDDRVRFLKGWFKDTLPVAPIEKLAVLRLDGDLYESTMDALTHLYDKLSPGGIVIIDDFVISCCQSAVHDFRQQKGISEPIQTIEGNGVFWEKAV